MRFREYLQMKNNPLKKDYNLRSCHMKPKSGGHSKEQVTTNQSWGFTYRSTARVILGQVLRIATCGTRTHRGDSL